MQGSKNIQRSSKIQINNNSQNIDIKRQNHQYLSYQCSKIFQSQQNIVNAQEKTKRRIQPQRFQWKQQQLIFLIDYYASNGTKWAQISNILGRNREQTKNKFYSTIRRFVRAMVAIGQKHTKVKKYINYASIMRPLQAIQLKYQPYEGYNYDKQWIKNKVLEYCKDDIHKLQVDKAEQLIDKIHKFNFRTKSFNIRQFLMKKQVQNNENLSIKDKQSVQKQLLRLQSSDKQLSDKNIQESQAHYKITEIQDNLNLQQAFECIQDFVSNNFQTQKQQKFIWEFKCWTIRLKKLKY